MTTECCCGNSSALALSSDREKVRTSLQDLFAIQMLRGPSKDGLQCKQDVLFLSRKQMIVSAVKLQTSLLIREKTRLPDVSLPISGNVNQDEQHDHGLSLRY